MPLLPHSDYQASPILFNGHLQTLFPSEFRRIKDVPYRRERLETPDGDFLDLDWSLCQPNQGRSRSLVILSHGLEGSSMRPYVLGMARAFGQEGWDALAWNYRSCSGEMNRLPRFYHAGATDDLHTVITHALGLGYQRMMLIGFSLGGSLTLKYVGERGRNTPQGLKAAIAFSTPCDLASSSKRLSTKANYVYLKVFLRDFAQKVRQKAALMPEAIDPKLMQKVRTIEDFDNYYTAPLHGFASAQDYYRQCSAKQFLEGIRIPTLIVNAANDPFLAPECYPQQEVAALSDVFLEMPQKGGHCGFVPAQARAKQYWSEQRALRFVQEVLGANL
ncbi:YheT family hydrolase [Eisenibacter elegans]|jgi:predicted alpha/beta-fold hydrolase|uniref:YheT family hydrolase n=1 Tax=Eisenibacter elegans TaxID=997 RepID=UPI00041A682F|nr:alpha/beta fold hydrolase [Eisenibacter elegans]